MSKSRKGEKATECQTLTLAQACRTLGISLPTASKIVDTAPADFPPVFWIGGRRYVLRRQLEQWLDAKVAAAASVAA